MEGHDRLNLLTDLDDEATNLRVAKALEFLGHPLFTATGPGIGPPEWVTLGHHLGTRKGNVKLLLSVPDGIKVDVTTGNEPWLNRSTEYTHLRTIELMILDTRAPWRRELIAKVDSSFRPK